MEEDSAMRVVFAQRGGERKRKSEEGMEKEVKERILTCNNASIGTCLVFLISHGMGG